MDIFVHILSSRTMAENLNAKCTICDKQYHVCNTCSETKYFKPWRTVTDTIEHYKIYTAIHGYTITKDIERAKSDLENCNLSELDTFNPEIQNVINKIMSIDEGKTAKRVKKSVKYVENKTIDSIDAYVSTEENNE